MSFLFLNGFFISLLFLLCISSLSAEAAVNKKLTFRWQANPVKENVSGYRLYYGSQSRSSAGSSQPYNYYIDFSKSQLCNTKTSSCKKLNSSQLSCSNLNGSTPKCTISNPGDRTYFALTACAPGKESDYTKEIVVGTPNIMPMLQALLLK